jgi:hypothetical protein
MSMVKLIREILVLPLRLLLLVNRYLSVVDQYVLVKWTWKVGRGIGDGANYIIMTVEKFGLEAGRDLAHEILEETRSAVIACAISWREREEKNFDGVKEWIDLAEEMGCAESYHLLPVKLSMSHIIAEYDHAEIVEEILACNCLPMEYTYQALVNKAFLLFQAKQYQQVEEIIDHVLRIKNDEVCENMKAVLFLLRDEDAAAVKLLGKNKKRLSEVEYNANIGLAYITADRIDDSLDWLYQAVMAGYNHNEGHPAIKQIVDSERFAEYCAMRN